MAVHKCYVFRLKRKNLLSPTPDACCALLALGGIQHMTGEPRPRYSALQLLGESGAYGETCEMDQFLWDETSVNLLFLPIMYRSKPIYLWAIALGIYC